MYIYPYLYKFSRFQWQFFRISNQFWDIQSKVRLPGRSCQDLVGCGPILATSASIYPKNG